MTLGYGIHYKLHSCLVVMCEIYPYIMEGRASSDTGMGDFEIYLKWSFNEKEAFITENQVYPLKVHDISDLPVLGPNCTHIFIQ